MLLALGLVALTVTSIYSTAASATRIKCWKNDEGIRECGNVVPPKYAKKRHTEINERGLTVKTYQRAKTKAEIAQEKRLAEEAAAKKKVKDRIARERAFKDRVLLDTFTTEEDLSHAHQERIATIDSRIQHAHQIIAGLKHELTKLRSDAAAQERAGNHLSAALQRDIDERDKQIAENVRFIEARDKEKIQLQTQYGKDLARFRTLKKRRRAQTRKQ